MPRKHPQVLGGDLNRSWLRLAETNKSRQGGRLASFQAHGTIISFIASNANKGREKRSQTVPGACPSDRVRELLSPPT